MVDSLKDLKAGNIVFARGEVFKIERISKAQVDSIQVIEDRHGRNRQVSRAYYVIPTHVKPGDKLMLDNGHQTRYLGDLKYEHCNVKTVPPGFTGGELSKSDYGDINLSRYVSGDPDLWARWAEDYSAFEFDISYAAVGEGTPLQPTVDVIGFTKLDLIAYLMKVRGPSTKDDLLRRAAALEGKPWVPTSNNQYFQGATADHKSMDAYHCGPCGCVIVGAGKQGRKQLYECGPGAEGRAKAVLARLGEGPARCA